jgi:hypothetical protein
METVTTCVISTNIEAQTQVDGTPPAGDGMSKQNKIAALVAAGVLGLAAIATVLVLTIANQNVTGVPTAAQPTSFAANITMGVSAVGYSSCESGGYSDIRDGAQVQIVNQKNEVLAVGILSRTSPTKCEFASVVGDIPLGQKMYGAKLGNANRGVIWKSEEEAQTSGWSLNLGG